MIQITTPLKQEVLNQLQAGDLVFISGTVYTARDAAHKRMFEDLNRSGSLPFDIRNQILYYVGPSPTPPGQNFGSAGPTTASRMDVYTPTLLELGLKMIIAKGYRNDTVKQSLLKNQAVYLVAIGGAGAMLGKCVKNSEIIAYEELGPEAIYKLEVENFPAIVCWDTQGNDAYIQ
ncbi:MAG: Fe-S-containing hydro-lyase [Erysipelotrichaceae bacterium]|nr:Fe-S-containing hydro-lyase [Erysipelotrichaceae bacterium]